MKPDDQELHSLTERLMKQAGTVTPPSGFTERVMDSIMQPEPGLVKSKPYWPWLLLAIFPVMVALSWYFFMPASVNDQIVWYLLAAAGALQHLFTSLLVFFRKLSDFSSLLWMGTAAVFSLLLLEEFLGKRKVRL
ncbi:MAG: hypothetical protein U0T82_01970 [Bacteroidales bacterium]